MKVKLTLGWNRVSPPHEALIGQDSFIQCTKLENFLISNKRCKIVGGTEAYNGTSLGTESVPWVKRSYHIRGDNSFVKRTFCFYNGAIYYGDDVAGTLTSAQGAFEPTSLPLDFTFQVSGNSILYFMTGEDTPYKYDGNGSYVWEKTGLSADTLGATLHLQRAWYWYKNSSSIIYSRSLFPEDTTTDSDEILVGDNAKDSTVRAIVRGSDESLYVFKSNSIYSLWGRTPSSFQMRLVTDKYGLATKRSICAVPNGFIFLNQNDNELYFFGGTEQSIKNLTEQDIDFSEIINETQPAIQNICMTWHDGLFRCAFEHTESKINANNCELVFDTNEPRPDGLPKWTLIKGTNVLSYSVWDKQDDRNKLVTGRSDAGKLVYHNRGYTFDGEGIEYLARTAEITASDDKAVRFRGLYVKGKPTKTDEITFRYYLDGRYSDRGEEGFAPTGETQTKGVVTILTQDIFNKRVIPRKRYSQGNSISFEFTGTANNTDLELYSVAFDARPVHKIRKGQYVG